MSTDALCEHCTGFGIQFKPLLDGTYLWVICRPCFGRGEYPWLLEWEIPERQWITAANLEELVAISIEVRLLAPSPPQKLFTKPPTIEILKLNRQRRKDRYRQMRLRHITKHIEKRYASQN